uniref:Uncharacterized protein n=1 Tax=Arundo donax TaxID=35708 RepID=A0A0A9BWN6_ARUDO
MDVNMAMCLFLELHKLRDIYFEFTLSGSSSVHYQRPSISIDILVGFHQGQHQLIISVSIYSH